MDKLAYLREETWKFLKEKVEQYEPSAFVAHLTHLGYDFPSSQYEEVLELLIDTPGRFLMDADIVNRPDLLERTVIEDNDGLEFLIDRNAAEGIQRGDSTIDLIRMYDKKVVDFSRDQVIELITNSEVFDQL